MSSFYIFDLCKWFILSKSFKFGPLIVSVDCQHVCDDNAILWGNSYTHMKRIDSSSLDYFSKCLKWNGFDSGPHYLYSYESSLVWREALFQNLVSSNLLVLLVKINNSCNSSPRFQSKTSHQMRLIRQFNKGFTITMRTIAVGHLT